MILRHAAYPSVGLVLLAAACGGSNEAEDDGVVCGAGTVLVAGQCLPVDPSGSDGSSGATSLGASSGPDPSGESSSDGADTIGPDGSSTGVGTTGEGPPPIVALEDAIIHDNPPDVASWPISTMITHLEFREGGLYVEFSKKDGPERWPDIVPPGWEGPLQYTLGFVEYIDGQWHASAAMQYWYGLDVQGGNVALDNQVAVNWYYDGRWGEMAGYQPADGEWIGVFVVAGNVRGVFDTSQSPVVERSNVVVVPMPGVDGAVHDF